MAAAVDPFSFAIAELSDDYISVFSHPDTVPRYLEKVRNWTGVEVQTGVDSRPIGIKGSWVSLNRVHLFLTEFLVTYQNEAVKQEETFQEEVVKQEEKKDVDLLEQGQCFSDHDDTDDIDNNDNIEIEEPNPVPNNETGFHDNSAESSDWFKWTAEVLPQIQRTRSKKAQIYSEPQTKDKIPEPLVFCANYQPTPDPAARKPPTLDAIEKVLKTVYDRVKLSGSSDASEEHVADTEYHCSRERSEEKEGKDMGLISNENNLSGLSVPFSLDCTSRNDDCTNPDGPTHNNNSHSVSEDPQTVSQSELTNLALSSNFDSDVDPKMVLPQLLHTNTGSHITAIKEESTNGESKAQMTRRSNRKRKRLSRTENDDDIQDAIPVKDPVFIGPNDKQRVQDKSYPEKAVSTKDNEEHTVVRKTRRKGQPQKKINYQKKVSELESPCMSVSHHSGVNRSRKYRNKMVVSEDDPVKKSDGRVQIKQKALKEDECKDYVCELCAYVTKKLSQLKEHKRRVHITKEFKCDKCGKVFGFGKDLKRHYLTHQKAENCCDICGKMYKGVRTLAEHKKTHERNYIKPEFPCEFCQKIFSTKYVLAYHIKSEHLGIKKTFLCPTCGKSFSQRNSYLQHANVHMGIKPYRCDTCGRSFSYEKSLKEHKYMHETDKQFECDVCHKKFRQSSGVAIHMKIHKEHKDYVCAACGKGFSQKQALIRHERIHRGEKPFSCALCKRTFTDSSILRRHMILIHKKDKHKWKEDTQNNVQRRTDFFISVIGKDEKTKSSEEVLDQTESVKFDQFARKSIKGPDCDPVLMRDMESGGVDSCSAEIMDESFNFLPVDVGSMPTLPPSTLPEIPVPAVPAATPVPILPQVKANHLLSESSSNINTLSAFTNLNTQTMSVSAALKQASSAAKTALDSSIAIGSALSPSSEPVDMSSQNQVPVHFNAHSSSVLSSYSLNDSQEISSSELCPNNLQQGGVPFSGGMTPGTSAYQSVVLMMSDDLNPLSFPSAAINNGVTTNFHDQPPDYDR